MSDYLQYGALGLLAIVMVGIYQLLRMFLISFLESFRDLVQTVKAIIPALLDVKSETSGLRNDINSRPCIAKEK